MDLKKIMKLPSLGKGFYDSLRLRECNHKFADNTDQPSVASPWQSDTNAQYEESIEQK